MNISEAWEELANLEINLPTFDAPPRSEDQAHVAQVLAFHKLLVDIAVDHAQRIIDLVQPGFGEFDSFLRFTGSGLRAEQIRRKAEAAHRDLIEATSRIKRDLIRWRCFLNDWQHELQNVHEDEAETLLSFRAAWNNQPRIYRRGRGEGMLIKHGYGYRTVKLRNTTPATWGR